MGQQFSNAAQLISQIPQPQAEHMIKEFLLSLKYSDLLPQEQFGDSMKIYGGCTIDFSSYGLIMANVGQTNLVINSPKTGIAWASVPQATSASSSASNYKR